MAKIRKYFKEEKTPDGYQRRKYITKLLYMYVMGYELDFGHVPAIGLLGATKYHEKHTGYFAIQLLLAENHEMIPLIVNSLQEDLKSRNDLVVCLALAAIANIGGKEMTETLAPDVLKLLFSSNASAMVKKKAAIAYLRLFRKNKNIYDLDPSLPEKLVGLLAHKDLGVLNAVITLMTDIAAAYPGVLSKATEKVIHILERVNNKEIGREYTYHSVPHPWMQIKCLRFLGIEPPASESAYSTLTAVLNRILASEVYRLTSVNAKNAKSSVLFEGIHLGIHLNLSESILASAVVRLSVFINSHDTNMRYLALESMTKLAAIDRADLIADYRKTVVAALKEPDVSIRRRALDLLYRMCTKETCREIIDELIDYLSSADVVIKEELVIKIAILAERFLVPTKAYVDVILQLVTIAGDYVGSEIWFRFIKVVVSSEPIQAYAAKACFRLLGVEPAHETLVAIAAYVLGEFGHLIADDKAESEGDAAPTPDAQFRALHARFSLVSNATKALLLSTYAKFANLFPEILSSMRDVFAAHTDNIDIEVQQRACEYLALTVPDSQRVVELMQTVFDAIPAWEEVAAAASAASASSASLDEEARKENEEFARDAGNLLDIEQNTSAPSASSSSSSVSTQSILDLLGSTSTTSSTTTSSTASASTLTATPSSSSTNMVGGSGNSASSIDAINSMLGVSPSTSMGMGMGMSGGNDVLTPMSKEEMLSELTVLSEEMKRAIKNSWEMLTCKSSGILYQDDVIQIGLKSEYTSNTGRVVLYFGNRSNTPISALTTKYVSAESALEIKATPLPQSLLGPGTQAQQPLHVLCNGPFAAVPTARISYTQAGKDPVNLELRLPIVLAKFVSAPQQRQVSAPDFISAWKGLAGEGQEFLKIFKARAPIDIKAVRAAVVDGFKFTILDGVDPKETNIVAVGSLHSGQGVDSTVLMRLESNTDVNMFRLTIRNEASAAANALGNTVVSYFGESN